MLERMPNPSSFSYDMIAIGESLRDVFYMIDEASVSCSIQKERCLLCLEYAEKIPVKRVVKVRAAGNASNAAVGAARLGLKTAIVSWLGRDTAGDDARGELKLNCVNERYVVTDATVPTSEATILVYQGERTQLVHFQPRIYKLPKLASTRCVYYSAMGEKHAAFDRLLLAELKKRRELFFTFQPGTTHVRRELKALAPLIRRSDLFILNKDEAHQILGDGERTPMNLLDAFHKAGAKIVIITDGENGADCFDGKSYWHMPVFPTKPVERTGAGDSFATAVTSALLKGEPITTALRWGAANSWSVIRAVGPQQGLLTSSDMKKILKRFSSIVPKPLS